jgi:glutamine cyclotransferase
LTILFISFASEKLQKGQQKKAMYSGLVLAVLIRVLLLITVIWLLSLKKSFLMIDTDLISEFNFPPQIFEVWGLTSFENELILSDGTDKIYFIESDNLSNYKRKISVVGFNKLYTYINELEYINGFIFANVWQEDVILKINPENGIVVGKLDLKQISDKYNENGVLNGIA